MPIKIKAIRQRDGMDCGPTCLAIIARYAGRSIPRDALRTACALSKGGVSLLAIQRTAEQFGLKGRAGKLTLDALAKNAPLPCMAHWDQNHFVVFYGARKRKKEWQILAIDPARGKVVYSEEELRLHWMTDRTSTEGKGIVLLLEPTPHFYSQELGQAEGPFRPVAFLWNYFRTYRRYFAQLALGLLIGALLQLVLPLLTQSIVDTGIGSRDISFVWLVLIAQMALLVGRSALDFIRSRILLHISTRINISLISDFFIKLLQLPMRFFETKLMGDLLQRIEDHRRVERFLSTTSLNLLFSITTTAVFSIVLFLYNIPIFVIFAIGTIAYALWIMAFLKRRRAIDYQYFEQLSADRNQTYQLLNGLQEIKLQGCERPKRWEWEDVQADLFKTNVESLNLSQQVDAGGMAINEIKNLLVTVMAATAVIQGEMTLGMMLAVQFIMGQLVQPVDNLMRFVYSWQDVRISLERMQEIHAEQDEDNDSRPIAQFPNANSSLSVRCLSFKYDPYSPHPILENVTLAIPQGKITAIVGASGSGKTTLIKLLLGFYEPLGGEIIVGDATPLRHVNLRWWRSQCGAVMQDGFLFSDTIARNIAIGDEHPDPERLRYAAKMACIDGYIEGLPLGFATKIGPDGEGLSQGQRQRILIARVVYRNPPIVLLDEATNALDATNERDINANLARFYEGKTVVVVAHRLSTVRYADRIVLLKQGRIAEEGTHEELVARQGYYYALVKDQLELGV